MPSASISRLRQKLSNIALGVATAITLTLFFAYLFTAYNYESRNLKSSAVNIASNVSRLVYTSPEIWRFQTDRLGEIIDNSILGQSETAKAYRVEIRDHEDIIVLQTGTAPGFPSITQTADIRDGRDFVATLMVTEDATHIWIRASVAGLLGLILGIVTYTLLQILPMRALLRRDELLRKNEIQLRQAQKMEAVGQLTSGVAHEFNNLLAVMMGNLELLQETLEKGTDAHTSAENAVVAARRGAELTQQLLSFSRRQALRPTVINLNDPITEMVTLLRSAIEESITIEVKLHTRLWKTNVDITQFETAILNLVTNARHAMPEGGTLTIETKNIVPDKQFTLDHRNFLIGPYVTVSISDTGHGMSKEVAARAIDPFFTTRPVGEGSGLGLSMVDGFSRQSDGLMTIDSEVNKGTTVTLYFHAETEHPTASPPSR